MCMVCLCHFEFVEELKAWLYILCTRGAGRAEGVDCTIWEGGSKRCRSPALGFMKLSGHMSSGCGSIGSRQEKGDFLLSASPHSKSSSWIGARVGVKRDDAEIKRRSHCHDKACELEKSWINTRQD